MHLTILSVERPFDLRKKDRFPLNWRVHHVKEVFMAMLPPKFELDGSGRVTLTCGPRGDAPQYSQVLGTSEYFVEDFDFEQLGSADQATGDTYILGVIERSLLDIAERKRRGEETNAAIRKAARETAARGFALDIEIPRLAKSSPDRRFKFTVSRRLAPSEGETWFATISDRTSPEAITDWMTARPHYLDMTDYFKKSAWADGRFVVCNRLGKEVYRSPELPVTGAVGTTEQA